MGVDLRWKNENGGLCAGKMRMGGICARKMRMGGDFALEK